jgi:uncharacterized protein (TIGR02453 family)
MAKSKSKSSAKRAASAKKDADAPAKKQTTKKAAKKSSRPPAAEKSSRPPAAEKKSDKKTTAKKSAPKKTTAKKTTAKVAAPAKQEAPARAAAPVKPSKKAVKAPGKSAPAKPKVAAPMPEPTPMATAKKSSRPPAAKKAAAKTDVAPPPPTAKKAAKKAAVKADVAPPTPAAPTPAAPSKPAAKKRAAKQAEPMPESSDDDGRTPAAARTGGAESSRAFRGFGSGLFEFLAELALNNDRSWFEAHKRRYESEVREPALAFIRAMGSRLVELSKHFVASDQKVGGSLMRIHRDTRFSPDKTPYKTNLGVQFRHASGKDVHAPGLYFHVDTDGVFLASGTWHPEPEPLAAIRNAIVERADAWKQARDDKGFREHWALEGDSLSRPPRGFDKQHPFVDDLRRKDHIAVCRLSADEIMRPDMVERIIARYMASAPYLRFLCGAIGVSF